MSSQSLTTEIKVQDHRLWNRKAGKLGKAAFLFPVFLFNKQGSSGIVKEPLKNALGARTGSGKSPKLILSILFILSPVGLGRIRAAAALNLDRINRMNRIPDALVGPAGSFFRGSFV